MGLSLTSDQGMLKRPKVAQDKRPLLHYLASDRWVITSQCLLPLAQCLLQLAQCLFQLAQCLLQLDHCRLVNRRSPEKCISRPVTTCPMTLTFITSVSASDLGHWWSLVPADCIQSDHTGYLKLLEHLPMNVSCVHLRGVSGGSGGPCTPLGVHRYIE